MKIRINLNKLIVLFVITTIFGAIEYFYFEKQIGFSIMALGSIWVYILINRYLKYRREPIQKKDASVD